MKWLRRISSMTLVVLILATVVLAGDEELYKPNVAKDLPGKVVAAQDLSKPGQIAGWYFDKDDTLMTKIVDQRKEGHKDVYYVELSSKTKTGGELKGIAELYYITVAGKQYLIAIGSVNLELTPPIPKEPGKTTPAQKLPGGE